MINKIKAIVTDKTEKIVSATIFDSISFEIFVKNSNIYKIGEEYIFYIVMNFSQEKGYVLYGFLTTIEKLYFLILQDCHGIGPKLALQILSELSIDAILNENKSVFESISGVGKKKAELIIIQLKSKITKMPQEGKDQLFQVQYNDFEATLKVLGYNQKEISMMINSVYKLENSQNFSISELVSKALHLKD
jgi:Holliday junction DNA helicase RuvA